MNWQKDIAELQQFRRDCRRFFQSVEENLPSDYIPDPPEIISRIYRCILPLLGGRQLTLTSQVDALVTQLVSGKLMQQLSACMDLQSHLQDYWMNAAEINVDLRESVPLDSDARALRNAFMDFFPSVTNAVGLVQGLYDVLLQKTGLVGFAPEEIQEILKAAKHMPSGGLKETGTGTGAASTP